MSNFNPNSAKIILLYQIWYQEHTAIFQGWLSSVFLPDLWKNNRDEEGDGQLLLFLDVLEVRSKECFCGDAMGSDLQQERPAIGLLYHCADKWGEQAGVFIYLVIP